METAERIRLLVAPVVADSGVELYDIEFASGVLRISLDRQGGVDMGAIGSLTRAISRLLDETDPIPGRFTLEVSSPGLERPLRTVEHFRRAIGETISVKTLPGVEGDRRCRGTLTDVDDEAMTVETGAGDEGRRRIGLADVERAATVFDWGPAPRPGRPKSSPSAKQKKAANR